MNHDNVKGRVLDEKDVNVLMISSTGSFDDKILTYFLSSTLPVAGVSWLGCSCLFHFFFFTLKIMYKHKKSHVCYGPSLHSRV